MINSTQIPNEIFDKWLAILTGAELKVLLFFVSQRNRIPSPGVTLSWEHVSDSTGLLLSEVINSFASLEMQRLLKRDEVLIARGSHE